ncbi:uncharacterized protein LOC134529632 isoform X2 [Bacillus rossius redtenbacheri]|uniref:uncharacterized protein LOC134529632 isoform X2 n=1 Tax=Bacillus rossius redtenbacheri TaxID=93214 RepID=UPI002FDD72BC
MKLHIPGLAHAQSEPVSRTTCEDGNKAPDREQRAPRAPRAPSKHRLRRFQRHFKPLAREPLLGCSYCLYGGDSILQGHLYITQNYFAFHSNILGYVTKLIIPAASVQDVSRGKTAKIIPNAVFVTSQGQKYVFGFLRFRKTTYHLMLEVWKNASGSTNDKAPEQLLEPPRTWTSRQQTQIDAPPPWTPSDTTSAGRLLPRALPTLKEIDEDYMSDNCDEDESADSTSSFVSEPPDSPNPSHCAKGNNISESRQKKASKNAASVETSASRDQAPRRSLGLKLSMGFALLLCLTSVYLMHRISCVRSRAAGRPPGEHSDDVYQKMYEWQTQLHKESSGAVQEFLSSHMARLSKVWNYSYPTPL